MAPIGRLTGWYLVREHHRSLYGRLTVKAPSPADSGGESTACETNISQAVSRDGSQLTYQRANDGRDTKCAADESCEKASLPQWCSLCDDDEATSENACSSDTCNSATDDESNGSRSRTTDSAANLKYHNGRQESPFRA